MVLPGKPATTWPARHEINDSQNEPSRQDDEGNEHAQTLASVMSAVGIPRRNPLTTKSSQPCGAPPSRSLLATLVMDATASGNDLDFQSLQVFKMAPLQEYRVTRLQDGASLRIGPQKSDIF